MSKKRKPVEEIIYKLKTEVEEAYFKLNPLKVFPDDFLSDEVKKELAKPIRYPDMFKFGVTVTGPDHRIRRKVTKKRVDFEQVIKTRELSKMVDLITKAKYVEILLPPGEKMKLWAEREFGIYFEKSRIFKEFSSLEEAKYLLYSRKKNQLMYKVPKDEAAVKRAVAEYEKYLSQMRAGLVKAFMRRGARKAGAEGLAEQVIAEKIG